MLCVTVSSCLGNIAPYTTNNVQIDNATKNTIVNLFKRMSKSHTPIVLCNLHT